MGAHGVTGHREDVVLLADDDLHLGGDADEQPGVGAADGDRGAEGTLRVGHGVDAGQRAGDHRVAGGVAGDIALHAGGQLAHRAGGDGDLHRQVGHVLDGGHGAGADRTHGGVQLGDGAVHGGGEGAVLQGGLQGGQRVGGAAGLFQLGLGAVHVAGVGGHRVVVVLLGLIQGIPQLLDLVVVLGNGIKALQAQFGDAALALGDAQLILVIRKLVLDFLLAVGAAVALGLGQLDLQIGDGILQLGDLLGVQAVVVFHQLAVGALGAVGVLHGRIVVGQPQGVVVLLGLVQFLLQLGQVGSLVLHALGVGGLGLVQTVVVVLLGGLDLFFHVGGVQRGDDVAGLDGVAHRHVHRRYLVGLDGIRSRDAGRGPGGHRAVDADRIGQVGFLQGGGAHKLIGQGLADGGGAAQKGDHKGQDQQQNDQKNRQLFVTFEPMQGIVALEPVQRTARGSVMFRHKCSEAPFA